MPHDRGGQGDSGPSPDPSSNVPQVRGPGGATSPAPATAGPGWQVKPAARDVAVSGDALLGSFRVPAVLLDRQRRLVGFNRPASDELALGRFIASRHGQLVCVNPVSDRALQSALADLLVSQGSGSTPDVQGPVVMLATAVHDHQIIASLSRLALLDGAAANPVALVSFRDIAATDPIDTGALRTVFGLTHAEARVAAGLADGLSIAQVAASSGVTVGTVRAQLKAVFVKTRVHRQPDLVRLLFRFR